MKEVQSDINTKMHRYYTDGYKVGYHDAIIGLGMKLLQHTHCMSSVYLQSWEEGYKEGYSDGHHEFIESTQKSESM